MAPSGHSSLRLIGLVRLLAPLLSVAITGCKPAANDAVRVAVIDPTGDSALRLPENHVLLSTQLLREATMQGLVDVDAEGRVIPGIADRWIVTDGGLAYIFRLHDAKWRDGSAISGETVRAALHQAIEQQAGTPLGQDLSAIRDIKAMAGRVIEIRLDRPMPDFLTLLAQPELGLAHKGKGWGPMTLRRDGAGMALDAIPPEKRGLPGIDNWSHMVRAVTMTPSDGARAIAAFSAGNTDAVIGGGFADLPRVRRGMLGNNTLRIDPVGGLFGLRVARADGFLASPAAREALAMAIDRTSLATALAPVGWVPTTRVVGAVDGDSGMVGERWFDIDLDGRRTLAARQVNMWMRSGGATPVVTILLPPGPGADILFDRLASDFGEIGVTLHRATTGAGADLVLLDSVARTPSDDWYFDRLSCAALRGPCSADADQLAAQARAASDPATAASLWAQAENALAASNVFIPLGPPIRWSLARPDMPGFAPNRWGVHPLMPLALKPVGG